MIDGQYIRAIEVLKKNEEGHRKLAKLLLDREVIFSEDLEEIFGKRPWDKKHVIPENGTLDKEVVQKQETVAENIQEEIIEETKEELPAEQTEIKEIKSEETEKPEIKPEAKQERKPKPPKQAPQTDSHTLF